MSDHQITVGSIPRTDETYEGSMRVSRDSATVTANGHSQWYEQGSRGQTFSVTTPLTGVILNTGMIAPPGAANATLLTLLNPVGSGVNFEILQGWVAFVAGTPQNGVWAWCSAESDVSITATEAGVTKGALRDASAVARCKAWSNAALTGSPAMVTTRLFPITAFNAALAGTTDQLIMIDNVNGALVVLPGSLVTIAPAQVINTIPGPDCTVVAGIMYAEVPRSPRSL